MNFARKEEKDSLNSAGAAGCGRGGAGTVSVVSLSCSEIAVIVWRNALVGHDLLPRK